MFDMSSFERAARRKKLANYQHFDFTMYFHVFGIFNCMCCGNKLKIAENNGAV
jgi:hypothetical protein